MSSGSPQNDAPSSEEINRQIARTRHEMDATLDEIQWQLARFRRSVRIWGWPILAGVSVAGLIAMRLIHNRRLRAAQLRALEDALKALFMQSKREPAIAIRKTLDQAADASL
jgi:hypothetical protein